MKITVIPTTLSGRVLTPTSKSYFQRAIAASCLAGGTSKIFYHNHCDDSMSAMRVAKALGAKIEDDGSCLEITGGGSHVSNILDCGESGLCLRMFSAIAATKDQPFQMTGSGSLKNRTHHIISSAFEKMGVSVGSDQGKLPLSIKGPIQGGDYKVDGSQSSQHITGLMMALPLADEGSILEIEWLNSYPYVDMTRKLLTQFGIEIDNRGNDIYYIPERQSYQPTEYQVERDWSAAAFWVVAGLINGNIQIDDIDYLSYQADSEIYEFARQLRFNVDLDSGGICARKTEISGFAFDAVFCPDLFPPLVALACHADDVCYIKGVHRLRNKESDRALALQQEFGKLGIKISFEEDYMVIHPGRVKAGTVNSHNDHRIAMALAVAALGANGSVEIEGAECVAKSYPMFWEELERLSAF